MTAVCQQLKVRRYLFKKMKIFCLAGVAVVAEFSKIISCGGAENEVLDVI